MELACLEFTFKGCVSCCHLHQEEMVPVTLEMAPVCQKNKQKWVFFASCFGALFFIFRRGER